MARILVIGGLADSLVNFRGILLSEMVARGHEVIACAAEDNREITDKLAAMGVRYTPLHFRRAGLNPLGDLALLFRLLRVLRQLRPDSGRLSPAAPGSPQLGHLRQTRLDPQP